MASAGVGAAWCWRGGAGRGLGSREHGAIARFLSASMPLLRAYGGMRFSSARPSSPEWEPFGSFLFQVPRVELVEGSTGNLLCCNLVWDEAGGAGGGPRGLEEGPWGAAGAGVTAREATEAALRAVRGVRAAAAECRAALRVEASSDSHLPDRGQWTELMGPLHETLRPAECSGGGEGGGPAPPGHPSDLTKVVLARRTDLSLRGETDPLRVLAALQERDTRAYQIYIELPSGEAFLGAPPERLYVRSRRAVASEAVAGTRPRGPMGDEGADLRLASELLSSPKEHAEFTVVREWVHEALGSVCDGVQVELPKSLLRQQSIQHLYGRLSGTMKPGTTDADLIRALHPTPAVCGQPQDRALALLDSTEAFDRGWYAGPFGWISGAGAEFVVAIRSALFHPAEGGGAGPAGPPEPGAGDGDGAPAAGVTRRASLYAGVGIVRGADIGAEWRELELKTQTLRTLLSRQPPYSTEPTLGALWARLLVEELCRFGVGTFCVAPGSRSSPLSIAAAAHPQARVITCIDERSLGFFAMGFSRARGRPAAVITSSGTAVANLLPSVIEASQSRVPLVVLTADRPADMRDTGSNQTIDQVKIFGGYPRWFADVAPPSADLPARTILTTVSMAYRHATGTNPGPVHLNLQFRDPLAPLESPGQDKWPGLVFAGMERWVRSSAPFTVPVLPPAVGGGDEAGGSRSRQLDDVVESLLAARRGLIVASGLSAPEESAAVQQLSELLGWPVVADATSGLRVTGRGGAVGPRVVRHLDAILLGGEPVWQAVRPDVVLDVGCHLVSKRVAQFLEWASVGAGGERRAARGAGRAPGKGATQWVKVYPHPARHDPSHAISHALEMPCAVLVRAVAGARAARDREAASSMALASLHDVDWGGLQADGAPGSPAADQARYASLLLQLDDVAASAADQALEAEEGSPELQGRPTEPRIARVVSEMLPQGWGLFLGNSMPIRDVDMFCSMPRDRTRPATSYGRAGPPGGGRPEGPSVDPSWDQQGLGALGAPVMANRGASGIDGVLSSAVGAAEGLGRGVTLLLGDVSALHDTNGLSMLQEARGRPPVVTVLVNNGGGGIFSFLPVEDSIPRDVFETVFATPPGVDFAQMVQAHGIAHRAVHSAAELPAALEEAWSCGEHCVVEVVTDRASNLGLHRRVQERVRAAVAPACALLSLPGSLGAPLGAPPGAPPALAPGAAPGAERCAVGPLVLSVAPYSVPLARAVTTGAGGPAREGALIDCAVETPAGPVPLGRGEVAPLPGLHAESAAEATEQAVLVCELLRGRTLPLSACLTLGGALRWAEEASGVPSASLGPSVRAGLEVALLTAAARTLGVPLARLLAAAAGAPAAGAAGAAGVAVCGLVSERDPARAAAEARRLAAEGFAAVKVKVGRGEGAEGVAGDVAVLRAVREAVGPGVALRADANRAWPRALAEEFAAGVAAAGVGLEFLEEPTAEGGDGADLGGLPVALDETVDAAARGGGAGAAGRVAEAVRARRARVVVLKPGALGGLHAALGAAAGAAGEGAAAVVSSAFETSVGLAAYAALAQALDAMAPGGGAGRAAHGLGTLAWLGGDVAATPLPPGPELPAGAIGPATAPGAAAGPAGEVERRAVAVHGAGWSADVSFLDARPAGRGAPPPPHRRPVVILHGFLGSAEDMGPLARALGHSRRVLAVDLPGHGGTEWRGEAPPSVADAAEAVAAVIRVAGLEAPLVVGYSMGGRVAMQLAALGEAGAGPAVGGLLCISASPGQPEGQRAARAAADASLAGWVTTADMRAFLDSWYGNPMWGSLRAHPQFAPMIERRLGSDRAAVAQALRGMSVGRQDDLRPWVERLARRVPVVHVAGSEDAKFVSLVREMGGGGATAIGRGAGEAEVAAALGDVAEARRRGEAIGVVVDGVGHAIPTQAANVVLALIRWACGGT